MPKCENPNCEKEITDGTEVDINGYTSCTDCEALYKALTENS